MMTLTCANDTVGKGQDGCDREHDCAHRRIARPVILRAVGWAVVALFTAASAYGWWFFVAVGEAHGPGLEIGIIAGAIAGVAATLLKRNRSPRNQP